jgi:hypothetical protein
MEESLELPGPGLRVQSLLMLPVRNYPHLSKKLMLTIVIVWLTFPNSSMTELDVPTCLHLCLIVLWGKGEGDGGFSYLTLFTVGLTLPSLTLVSMEE